MIPPPLDTYLVNNHINEIQPINLNHIKYKWCVYNLPPCFDIDLNHLDEETINHINGEFNLINGNLKIGYLVYLDKVKDDQTKKINDMDQLRRKYILKHTQAIVEHNKMKDQYNHKVKALYDIISSYFSPNIMLHITNNLINDNYDQQLKQFK